VQLIGDWLYVANTDNIMKFPYSPGQTSISAPGTLFTDLPGTIEHHWTKALLASPDGSKLYVGVGSNSNIGENGLDVEYRRAAVLEVDVAGAGSRIFASGIRNPTGLQWEPQTGTLWAIANERDEIGADLVPDYLTSVREGGFYGWPYSYYGQHLDRGRSSSVRTWWPGRSSPITRWGRTWPRWGCGSRRTTPCRPGTTAARSWPNTAAGTARR